MKSRISYFMVALLIYVTDQASKAWASRLEHAAGITLIDGFFHLSYVENSGIAWGLFADSGAPGKMVLSGISLLAAAAIVFYALRTPLRERAMLWGFSFVLGGVLGNLTDRISRGAVIDFLDFTIVSYKWPTFNVADMAISMGAAILILDTLRSRPGSARVQKRETLGWSPGGED
ncbi:MAG: signal peptidase II [Acidobacteria bacterium]|nr:signal peptidase II [Acidobacteriota bacterium]